MKNKFITSISLMILSSFIFTSCSQESVLNSITEENAIKLSREILARQEESTFKQPTWFTYKYNYNCEYSAKLYDTGINISSTKIYKECLFNLDDLIIKEVTNIYERDHQSTIESYIYYDESKTQLVTLTNENGKKIKSYEDIRHKDYATIRFKSIRESYNLTKDEDLVNFETNLASLKETQEKIKDKKDQYIKLTYGSNDNQSLQFIVDKKLDKSETRKEGNISYVLKGYQTMNTNNKYILDLIDTKSISYDTNISNSEFGFYINDVVKLTASYTYGKVKISLPNINDYKEV